ncbi:MAG TPA: DUF3078 domain-containing protein [Bacteroidales bacterium]|nr:DUF3078 domain-containing protein [Bacteroidales bacterium]
MFFLVISVSGFSQENVKDDAFRSVLDSLRNTGVNPGKNSGCPEIKLSKEQAINFLRQKTKPSYWINPDDSFRKALNHLVFEASSEKYDSVETFLKRYPYDSLAIPWDKFYIWEPLKLKIPVVEVQSFPMRTDSITMNDTLLMAGGDTLALRPVPSSLQYAGSVQVMKDTTLMVIIDTLENTTSSRPGFPFRYLDYPYQSDSIKVAVQSLLDYVRERDSTIINFTGSGRSTIPVWLNTRSNGTMRRYWLKNEFNDSVTVWIGNEGRNVIGLYLEQGINFRKPMKQADYSSATINAPKIDRSKLEKQNIIIKKHFWNYRTESSLVFSQSALSNWVKGGENSVSSALDITGYADFKNPDLKLSSANFARLKLGFMASGGEDIRKNLDLLETNSKLNHKAFGKFDFSAIMLFKTQVAIGKSYTKVNGEEISSVVSKFMNPAILTLGFGLDYKPNKETSINFSPLSYKATFVPAGGKITKDSLLVGKIDQTRYGVEVGKTSKHEPGASIMISRISRPVKNVTLTNRVQLFTNYINNPQNIDVDWEMIAVYNLNWFTDLRLNTHLIFDDDTRTTVMEGGLPVKLEDGTEKKTARIQFKELFGVSLMFKF